MLSILIRNTDMLFFTSKDQGVQFSVIYGQNMAEIDSNILFHQNGTLSLQRSPNISVFQMSNNNNNNNNNFASEIKVLLS